MTKKEEPNLLAQVNVAFSQQKRQPISYLTLFIMWASLLSKICRLCFERDLNLVIKFINFSLSINSTSFFSASSFADFVNVLFVTT